MILLDRRNRPISDWRNWTRPKEHYQWRSSRSAMELARSWFTSPVPITPPEISSLLSTHPKTAGAVLDRGWPELKTPLPVRGEGRNHDLVLIGRAKGQPMLLAIEAKVDETMGPQVGAYWRESRSKSKDQTKPSLAWRRIDALVAAAFGPRASATSPPWSELPYQMLTALVGTAIEATARGGALGVFAIQEFVTDSARKASLQKNQDDFIRFLNALGVRRPTAGILYGPFDITLEPGPVITPVLVGKVRYDWRSRDKDTG